MQNKKKRKFSSHNLEAMDAGESNSIKRPKIFSQCNLYHF